MLPPDTIQTILPEPANPAVAQATGQAPAPSAITRFRSAIRRTASPTCSSDATRAPSNNCLAISNILGKTLLPPIPSTNEGLYSTATGLPAASAAESGAAVATSAA